LYLLYDFQSNQEEQNEKKAVMVFIHGGVFYNGSGSLDFYSPDYLIDENVIVVTINYRLNALGNCTDIKKVNIIIIFFL